MDPKALGSSDWQQVVNAVNQFWFFAAFMIVAALSFGLAHAIIPSLRTTGDISPGKAAARPVLYVVSAIALLAAAVMLFRGVGFALTVIRGIYPRWWI